MALSVARYHEVAFGVEPTEVQLKLYNSWPDFRGFSDNALNPVLAEAVILVALKASAGADRVVLVAPHALEEWLLKQIESIAIRIFEECPGRFPERAPLMIPAYAKLFQKVKMTGRILQMPEEPAHWVSFGFLAEDTLPPWMHGRLLPLE